MKPMNRRAFVQGALAGGALLALPGKGHAAAAIPALPAGEPLKISVLSYMDS